MKNKVIYHMAIAALFISLISGCSSLPIQSSSAYFKDLYKRIKYTSDGNYRVLNIFYATTRQLDEKQKTSVYFTNDIANNMTLGEVNIKIDPRLRIEKMIPRRLQRQGLIGIQSVSNVQSDAFFKTLSDTVKASPHKSLLVIVFGYKDDFEATAIKAAYFSYLLDINTPILLFDWPGDQPVDISGYKKAQTLASASGAQLGELLVKIGREVKPEKLWVKASSLGCQVVCDAFDHMYKYPDFSDQDTEIDHVILAAPDVSQNEFDEKFKDEMAALSKKLTTYVSSDDTALLVSGLINDDTRLGRQKPRIKDPGQLEEAKELLYLKSQNPDKITVIDVTPINFASYKHGYYLESPEFFDDCYMRMFDTSPSVNRRLYLLKYKGNTDYWVLQGNS